VRRQRVFILALLLLAPHASAWQEDPTDPPEALPAEPPAAPAIADLDERLAALDPSDPRGYFLLGELVADEARTRDELTLARRLLVLSYELDRRAGFAHGVAAPACMALAHLERVDETRAWLRAMAGAIDPRYASTDWNVAAAPPEDEDLAFRTATLLGLVRAGEGSRAVELLDDPRVRRMLDRYSAIVGHGAITRIETAVRNWPCPRCANRRYETGPGRAGPETRLCGVCRGNPGPELTRAEFIAHLTLESRLLHGIQRSWSAQVATDGGAPLLDPDPRTVGPALAIRYGFGLGAVLWRDGRWVEPED
jgi:hypothetical protein